MVQAVKNPRIFQAPASNAAGATTTGTGFNLTATLGEGIVAKVTNGATGPTVGCLVTIQIANDGSGSGVNWMDFASARAGTGNNEVSTFVFDLPDWVMNARVVFSGNTGQAVTVEAQGHELTSVG